MAQPSDKLAKSLEVLQALQDRDVVAIRARDISRTHRERLSRSGFLQEVMKGWYIPTKPGEPPGESTAWYTSYWKFCASYLRHRFGEDWCLSPEQSLALQTGNWTVPQQLLVRAPAKARNNVTGLPHGTSLLDIRGTIPEGRDIEDLEGLRVLSLPAALIAVSEGAFRQCPTDLRTALSTIRNSSEVLDRLLEGGHSIVAGRLAGAFRNIGRDRIADEVLKTMRAADYDVRETDPFNDRQPSLLATREVSPYINRIRLMWQTIRESIPAEFPHPPGLPHDRDAYLKRVEDNYVTDAYHSLSIEGYRVSPNLIERVRSGRWNPDANEADNQNRDALAARGYWQAHQRVRESIEKVLGGANPGEVVDQDHGDWYRELFSPSIAAGLLRPSDLAGYRNGPVYIRKSMHVPPRPEAVREAMPVFFDLLREEQEPTVRIVLGHFGFVYIHPYMDGNGRMGRFLMNVMMAAAGFPWTVIPVERRIDYMAALEEVSVQENIAPFSSFLNELLLDGNARTE